MTAPTPAVLTAERQAKVVELRRELESMTAPFVTLMTNSVLWLLDTIDAQAAEIERLRENVPQLNDKQIIEVFCSGYIQGVYHPSGESIVLKSRDLAQSYLDRITPVAAHRGRSAAPTEEKA